MEQTGSCKRGKGYQEYLIKDTWTKPKWDKIKGGKWGWMVLVGVIVGKWRQVYLNNIEVKKRNSSEFLVF